MVFLAAHVISTRRRSRRLCPGGTDTDNWPRPHRLPQLWIELRRGISDALLACQPPFNTLAKFPNYANQDLRLNLHLAVFHRGERVPLIPISVYACSLAGNSQGEQRPGRWS